DGLSATGTELPTRNVRFHVGSRTLSGHTTEAAKATFMTHFGLCFVGQGIQSAPIEMVDRICYPINLPAAIFNRCSSHMMYRPREFRSDDPATTTPSDVKKCVTSTELPGIGIV